jgi:hypothetical protein
MTDVTSRLRSESFETATTVHSRIVFSEKARSAMTVKARFQTTDKSIAQLKLFERQGVLIECGKCSKCATIHRIETLNTIPTTRAATASCQHCGSIWHLPYVYSDLPLWLATSYRNQTLWALNEFHLKWLEEFIGAEVREDNVGGSSALHAVLPRWMTASKNRKDVMRVLARLRQKLEAARS